MSVRRAAFSFALVVSIAALTGCAAQSDTDPWAREDVGGAKKSARAERADDDGDGESSVLQPSNPAPAPTTSATPGDDAAPAKKVLELTWYGQEKYYWCGPGSTRMALGTKMSDPPSQTELANVMGTTTNGTDHVGLVVKALNKYIEGAGYTTRTMNDPPTAEQRERLKQDLVARVGKGYPIVANVVSGWRPAGYPSGTIYHYVAVLGYDESGAKVLIADPAAEGHGGGPSWNGVTRTYWISVEDLGTWIGGKGYTG